MKVWFKLNDGRVVSVDTESDIEVDDALFGALMDTIEKETGDWDDMMEVTEVKIVM